jgi:hypothetical protein
MQRIHIAASAIAGLLGFAVMQFVPGPEIAHPPVVTSQTIEANMDVPVPVAAIFSKACRNCHSNETAVPWYGKLAPGSWLLARDVNKARRAMNLSTWNLGAGRSPGLAAATLAAACTDIRSGRMPLPQYRLMHPESRLSEADKQAFCQWANQSSRDLLTRAAKIRVHRR